MPEPFEVKDVELSVKYHGDPFACPVKATLSAKFTTNKPGKNKFSFMLFRDNGMKQVVSSETFGSGYAVFHKDYTFKKSDSRKYMVIVNGSPISTNWVPMHVNCSAAAGSFSNGSKPTN
jgi:hypothetical protein